MPRLYRYDEAERLRRRGRANLPHPTGETKTCARCGRVFVRLVKHIPFRWRALRFCSVECGRPERIPMTIERFESYCVPEPNSGCWLWLGSVVVKPDGLRATTFVDGKHQIAARVGWTLYNGPIPTGMDVCHKCDMPLCVNPDHWWLGTHQDNMDDMVAKGRRASAKGEKHPSARLTESQVLSILADPRPAKKIAPDYGVADSTISMIKSGHNWRHLHAAAKA